MENNWGLITVPECVLLLVYCNYAVLVILNKIHLLFCWIFCDTGTVLFYDAGQSLNYSGPARFYESVCGAVVWKSHT
jgi:hypothetical protein